MRNILLPAFVLLAATAAAAATTPAITLKSNIYGYQGASNYFTLTIGTTEATEIEVDCGNGPVKYSIVPAGTDIPCTVTEAATVKIYGDASLIDYFYAEGCYLGGADFGDCVNLDVLNLEHNELTSLDLSKYTKLRYVNVGDNPFTQATPFVLGSNHPLMQIIEVSNVTWLDPDFDITTFPELQSMDAYGCRTLSHLDPTKCPKLLRISVDSCPLTSLDVTKNPQLLILNIEDSGISSIDISKNPLLTEFYAVHASGTLNTNAKLTSIDVTNNPELVRLALNGNRLSSVDVSKNTKLVYLNVGDNLLSGIDVSTNTALAELDIYNNYMDYATMPLPGQFETYNYWQRQLAVDRSYKVGSTLDFSDRVLREGTVTTARLFSSSLAAGADTEITDKDAFTFADGKLTLHKVYADSLYVQFDNDVFSEWPLTTQKFLVKSEAAYGQPSKIITAGVLKDTGTPFSMGIGFNGATPEAPVKYYVDLGNGELEEFYATSDKAVAQTYYKKGSQYVGIYAPEGTVLSAFAMANTYLTSIDVAAATEMRELSLTGTSLYSIDLATNRCLRSLDLSDNYLSTIDLTGINGKYHKNVLSHINLAKNRLSSVTLNDTRTITHLNLSDNKLEAFDQKDFDNIVEFRISNNAIESIDLSYMTSATTVDVSCNHLTSIVLPETNVFEDFDVSSNFFTLADIPEQFGTSSVYHYAPQHPVSVPTKGPGIDLSAQNRVIGSASTKYTLRSVADGKTLTAGTDYREQGGRISFLAPIVGQQVYCEMTNPAFPDFANSPLCTTPVLAAEFPTNCVAEFTTPTGGQTVELSLGGSEGAALYIDWNGQATDLSQYPLKETYTLYSATTVAGARVKVYTYSPEEKVTIFSFSGATMTSVDLSRLTDAFAISLTGASLKNSDITFPSDLSKITELTLDGNLFTTFDPSEFPSLISLALGSNSLTSLDLSGCPTLQLVSAPFNNISSVTLNNPRLWHLALGNNKLADIDLNRAPSIENLGLSGNLLSTVDVSALTSLKQFVLDRNSFTFATLPLPKESWIQYTYANQAAMDATCNDGVVDLSGQATVDGTPTTYRWFLDDTDVDEDGNILGEELYIDEEYTLADGVTTFLHPFHNAQCVMTNEKLPSLTLHTKQINVTAGINSPAADESEPLQIVATRSGDAVTVEASVADGTRACIYGIDGHMIATARFANGQATLQGVPSGVALITVGNAAVKVALR